MVVLGLFLVLGGCGVSSAHADEAIHAMALERATVVISDTHMGLGRRLDGSWDPKEDFRWEGALRGFLNAIHTELKQPIDLVIAGDFLELWQPPSTVQCSGADADHGCTIDEMKQIVRYVLAAHQGEFSALADFTHGEFNNNRIYIIPGNHDSALVIPEVWQLVDEAMEASPGRFTLVTSGVWTTDDGEVLVEHGHQIGSDVNRYKKWPEVTERRKGTEYIVRPWGELFVQKLFNAEESNYPIIDNLSPETAGARYRLADRGLWGSIADVAKFIAFNIFETSSAQRAASLGGELDENERCTRAHAEALGHRLVLGTLKPGDPFRLQAEAKNAEAKLLRNELDAVVKAMPDEDIQNMCAQQVDATTLSALVESTFVPREAILSKHLESRIATYTKAAVFVYGHTHQYERAWDLKLRGGHKITVLNSGAFQRLIDEEGYLKRVESMGLGDQKHKGLSRIALDSLAPCYGTVIVQRYRGVLVPEMKMWHMPDGETGKLIDPTSKKCK